jgi:hypothetical protein
MDILDFILNLAALLLWFGWRQTRARLVAPNAGVSLLSTLRRTDAGQRRSHLLSFLGGLLLVRFVVYWQVGQTVDWVAKLPFGLVPVSFRSRYWDFMLAYSFCSFAHALALAYLWMIALSLLHPRSADNPQNRFVREQIGILEAWPAAFRLMLPFFLVAGAWSAMSPLLEWMSLLPAAKSVAHRFQQAAVHGLAFYLELRWLLIGLLVAGLLNSYVYFGQSTIWIYVQTASQRLLQPLRWVLGLPLALLLRVTRIRWVLFVGQLLTLQAGRVDLVPLLGICLLFFASLEALRGLSSLYVRLPFQ